MNNTTLTVKTNKALKKEAQQFFESLGINFTSAINMFLNDVVSNQKISFSIEKPVALHEMSKKELSPLQLQEIKRIQSLSPDDFITYTANDFKN